MLHSTMRRKWQFPVTGHSEQCPPALLSPVLSQSPTKSGFLAWGHTSCPDVLRSLPRVALQVADQRADRQSPQWVCVPFSG